MGGLRLAILALCLACLSGCVATGIASSTIGQRTDCYEAYDAGPCKAAYIRFYYDADAGACREFVWGGCQGNVPFDSLEQCRTTCE